MVTGGKKQNKEGREKALIKEKIRGG